MAKEDPIKKDIDLSSFLCDLYSVKYRIDSLIIELEKKVSDKNV